MNDTVMLTIRVPRHLRDEFQAQVEQQDLTVSQVLRAAMRDYLSDRWRFSPGAVQPVIARPTVSSPEIGQVEFKGHDASIGRAAPVETGGDDADQGMPFAGLKQFLEFDEQ